MKIDAQSIQRALAQIENETEIARLDKIAVNARNAGVFEVEVSAVRRKLRLAGKDVKDPLEQELSEALAAREHLLLLKHGKAQKASYTRRMIKNGKSTIDIISDWVLDSKPTSGFKDFVDAGIAEFAAENIAIRHPGRFKPEVVEAARARLQQFGVLDERAASQVISNTQQMDNVDRKYTLLGPLYPAEKCYLYEVLLWRAFARFPEMEYDREGADWRFASDTLDDYDAPLLRGIELSEKECQFAGIPEDSRYSAMFEDRESSPLDHYEKMIELARKIEPPEPDLLKKQMDNMEEAAAFHAELQDWLPVLNDYLDQFESEICLALRRGQITARATLLPFSDRDECDRFMERERLAQ